MLSVFYGSCDNRMTVNVEFAKVVAGGQIVVVNDQRTTAQVLRVCMVRKRDEDVVFFLEMG